MGEYRVEQMNLADRWTTKGQSQEIERFNQRFNQLGSEGWELVGYEPVPLYGSFATSLKGYAYLCFWKRPAIE